MRSVLIIFIAFIPFFIGACQNNVKSKYKESFILSDYAKWKKQFPDSLITHFPNDLGKDWISYGSSCKNSPKSMLYLTLLKKLSEEDKIILKNRISTPDSCLIKIYLNRNTYGFNRKGLGKCSTFIPIPDYDLINDGNKSPSDTKYYVLETSKRIFINHDLYLRYYLPKEWKNGMSRGVGVSEKENIIFYWLIMW